MTAPPLAYPFALPPLRHADDALAPWLDARSLRAHRRHHEAVLERLNEALADVTDLHGMTIEAILRDPSRMPPEKRDTLLDLAGAHANHQFFWKIIGPPGRGGPQGALVDAIAQSFGSLAALKQRFIALALDHDGQGWMFLSLHAPRGATRLELIALPGNGSVLPMGRPGILCCDLWRHAYAAQYGADRAAWVDAWWNIVDWGVASHRLDAFLAGADRV